MAIEERVSGMQLSQENENLKAEIRDLNEKLETLKSKKKKLFLHPRTNLSLLFRFFSKAKPRQGKAQRG